MRSRGCHEHQFSKAHILFFGEKLDLLNPLLPASSKQSVPISEARDYDCVKEFKLNILTSCEDKEYVA